MRVNKGVRRAVSWLGFSTSLEISHVEVTLSRLPAAWNGLKIVQISDIHMAHFFHQDDLEQLVQTINAQQPDVVCFTGDLVDRNREIVVEDIQPSLSKINAPLGKYAVLGNHDYANQNRLQMTISLLEDAEFNVLMNTHATIHKNECALHIAGLDDMKHGAPSLTKALEGIPGDGCTILLVHEPDFALQSKKYAVDLQLSGHSHGGQIRLPFIGHVRTPSCAKHYVQGLYHVENMVLYVNRGVGMTFLPIRFCCRPELTVVTLHHAPESAAY
ncbi:metallophosphoesterase [Longirhabdus pacifica]|uniref:metallophosphoesterase n=1 Tax=Longirhabdus pacifica TaxID=2305227 RepID=UPI0010093922|nr:metallophosphoesterase [Longirhabdus pacifica]